MSNLWGIDTRVLYSLLLGAIALERLVELAVTRRNRAWALSRGGLEVGEDHYSWMVAMHSLLLVASPTEVWLLDRPFIPPLALVMMTLLVLTMALRYWAIATLGRRWTTRVICVPGLPVVTGGPYRFFRHPNYLAVVVEVLALPLVHSAWLTAALFGVANYFVLRVRIRVEESALESYNDYSESFPEVRHRTV